MYTSSGRVYTDGMQILTRTITTLFAALSTCSIICGAACDFAEVGECAGLGGMFGPCDEHLAFLCLNGLECLSTRTGSACVPPANVDLGPVEECGSILGGDVRCSSVDGHCVVSCIDGPCGGSSVCDPSTRTCVYPHELTTEQD